MIRVLAPNLLHPTPVQQSKDRIQIIVMAASNLKCNTYQSKVCIWTQRSSTASFSPRTG
jgi:hypothetical protein